MEHELGGFDSPSEMAEDKVLLLSEKHEGKSAVFTSCTNDTAITFTKLNRISEQRRARDITKRLFSPIGSLNTRRVTGTIKWYSHERNYGFIRPHQVGVDVFVHSSAFKSDGNIHLWPGTHVEYETIINFSGKMQAINVTSPSGKLLEGSRKLGFGGVSTNKSNMVSSHLANKYSFVAKSGEWHRSQYKYTMWEQANSFVKCGAGWSGFAWCYYCGKIGHFHHT